MEVLYKKVFEHFGVQYYENFNNIPPKGKLDPEKKYDRDIWDCLNATKKHPHFKYLSSSKNKDEFIKNYGNLMTGVWVERYTYVVESFEDKVSIKLFYHHKIRNVGKPYFKRTSNMDFITYKFENNDLFYGRISHGNKKNSVKRIIRRNYFGGNPGPLCNLSNLINLFLNNIKTQLGIDIDKHEIIKESFDSFLSKIPGFNGRYNVGIFTLDEQLYKHYLTIKNIKYPNNFTAFINKVPAPNKRLLNKYNNKLVDCFMHTHKMKGDKIKKILHNLSVINEFFYHECVKLFGENFIKNQSYEDLKHIFSYPNGYNFRDLNPNFTDKEKKLAFSTLIDFLLYEGSISSYLDHIEFYIKLNNVEKIKWKSFDITSFRNEHVDWTDKWSYYTKGTYFRHYNEAFIKTVEQPIGNKFYPLILTKSKEYIDESAHQNNCVKTYIDRAQSLIISIRENDINSDERATVEYSIRNVKSDNDSKIILKRIQSLGKFNKRLDDKWNSVLIELDDRINKFINELGFDLPKVTVDFKHKKIESESGFTDKGGLIWLSPVVNNTNYLDGDFLF